METLNLIIKIILLNNFNNQINTELLIKYH